jgi:hypothetical protein
VWPMLKYTLGRLGVFVAVFLLLLPVPGPSVLVKALVAVLVSLPLAWYLLRRWRDQATVAIAGGVARRRARREELRAALAGEDDPDADPDR